jgi:hypothetical protein
MFMARSSGALTNKADAPPKTATSVPVTIQANCYRQEEERGFLRTRQHCTVIENIAVRMMPHLWDGEVDAGVSSLVGGGELLIVGYVLLLAEAARLSLRDGLRV